MRRRGGDGEPIVTVRSMQYVGSDGKRGALHRPSASGPDEMKILADGVLELGIPDIDLDHHRLIKMVNSDWALFPVDRVINHLCGIRDEACAHFEREELLMSSSRYSGRSYHAARHKELIIMLLDNIERLKCARSVVDEAFIADIISWMVDHINSDDRDFALFIHGGGFESPT